VRRFLATESAGGFVLLLAAVVGLVWANSPWRAGYDALWSTELAIGVGRWVLTQDLHHWVNDGLMALFFFVIGLEIKREVVAGELRDPRTAAVPVMAALGGMVVPAALYLAVTSGGAGSHGWGIPMATDIAFALGVVAVLGRRVPASLKLFLLTLAIVDDIGAIAVIALFYTADLDVVALSIAGAILISIVLLRAARVTWAPAYVVAGIAVWLATQASGVHATIAGVLLGLLVPVRPMAPAAVARDWAADLGDDPSAGQLATMGQLARAAASPAERLEHRLHPWTSLCIVPLFALANAGVELSSAALDAPGGTAVAAGVALGLLGGKTLGVLGATWLAVRTGLGRLPEGATWAHVGGIAAVAGIGFTVSLFVAELAFPSGSPLIDAAKLGVLGASAAAAVLGALVLVSVSRRSLR